MAYTSSAFEAKRVQFDNIILPSLIGMAEAGMIAITVIMLALKSVPREQSGKVANFRSVAFTMGIYSQQRA